MYIHTYTYILYIHTSCSWRTYGTLLRLNFLSDFLHVTDIFLCPCNHVAVLLDNWRAIVTPNNIDRRTQHTYFSFVYIKIYMYIFLYIHGWWYWKIFINMYSRYCFLIFQRKIMYLSSRAFRIDYVQNRRLLRVTGNSCITQHSTTRLET